MTSGKSACYTRQKMLLPTARRGVVCERRNEGTNANGRQFLYVYLDGE